MAIKHSLGDLLAAPLRVTLDGKEYRFSPLAEKDFAELQTWGKDKYRRERMQLLEGETDPDVRLKFRLKVSEDLVRFTVGSDLFKEILDNDAEANTYIVYLMLRREHPEMTLEGTRALFSKFENVMAMRDMMDSLLDTAIPPEKKTAFLDLIKKSTGEKSIESSPNDTDGPPALSES